MVKKNKIKSKNKKIDFCKKELSIYYASYYCSNCNKFLCIECNKIHLEKEYQKHETNLLEEVLKENLICKKHKKLSSKILNDKELCEDCLLDENNKNLNEIIEINDYIKENLKIIENFKFDKFLII